MSRAMEKSLVKESIEATATPPFSSQKLQGKTLYQQKRLWLIESPMMVTFIFLAAKYF